MSNYNINQNKNTPIVDNTTTIRATIYLPALMMNWLSKNKERYGYAKESELIKHIVSVEIRKDNEKHENQRNDIRKEI
mgnify:CR=1 FL=1|jgi:hypothetical protein